MFKNLWLLCEHDKKEVVDKKFTFRNKMAPV